MPKSLSVQNNFVGGLRTEATGLNFPENACTAMDNSVVSLVGDTLRRNGINFEENYELRGGLNPLGEAISYFRWKNAGGDGLTEILVVQVGGTLFFFESSNSTLSQPLSTQLLNGSSVNIAGFLASGSSLSVTGTECQYSAGNGYLFVYHPYCDPFFCTFANGGITANLIPVQIRDFAGIPDGLGVGGNIQSVTQRPATISAEHQYNLQNQGWASSAGWTVSYSSSGTSASSKVSFTVETGNIHGGVYSYGTLVSFTTASGLTATSGQPVVAYGGMAGLVWTGSFYTAGSTGVSGIGVVNSYSGTTISIAFSQIPSSPITQQWAASYTDFSTFLSISPASNQGLINAWFSAVSVYPANSDVWWAYKDSTGAFNPATTLGDVTVSSTPAPNGSYILNAFNQGRTNISGIPGLTKITTMQRPSTGAWFQGRVFYSGVNDSQAATGDAPFYTWTENIYFSQIITDSSEFGYCFQTNDPTSETLFDLLSSDGGVIQIQGCGAIYKLFAIQNGLLVFASNGVWFITGSTGIGFTATDYTITKISAVQSISGTSQVDVLGFPVFWNEEGIYMIEPNQQGGLSVNPMTLETILSFYNDIPLDSKKYARGSYNPVTYVLEWVYRSTEEAGISNRYQFDSALCYNTIHKCFYPYSIANNNACYVCGLVYMNYPTASSSGVNQLNPTFKYLTAVGSAFVFSEENDDTTWLDWFSYDGIGVDAPAYFTVGYSLPGKAIMKWQPTYVHMYSRNNVFTSYAIQGIWDYSINPASGKETTSQLSNNFNPNYGMLVRRHKIRGHGRVLQLNIESITGQPFDIIGWAVLNDVDAGV